MMLLRANVIAKGFSGARAELVGAALRDAQRRPLARGAASRGRVGASGDLAPLAASRARRSSARAMLHRGDGARLPPRDAARERGARPGDAGRRRKGSRSSTARRRTRPSRRWRVMDAQRLWRDGARRRRHVARGAAGHARSRSTRASSDARGQDGQQRSAALLRALLADSEIRESHRDRRSARAGRVRAALHAAGARPGARRACASPRG